MIKARLAERLSEESVFTDEEVENFSSLISDWESQSVNGNSDSFEVGEHTLHARLQDNQLCIRYTVVLGIRNGQTTGADNGFQFRIPVHN